VKSVDVVSKKFFNQNECSHRSSVGKVGSISNEIQGFRINSSKLRIQMKCLKLNFNFAFGS